MDWAEAVCASMLCRQLVSLAGLSASFVVALPWLIALLVMLPWWDIETEAAYACDLPCTFCFLLLLPARWTPWPAALLACCAYWLPEAPVGEATTGWLCCLELGFNCDACEAFGGICGFRHCTSWLLKLCFGWTCPFDVDLPV